MGEPARPAAAILLQRQMTHNRAPERQLSARQRPARSAPERLARTAAACWILGIAACGSVAASQVLLGAAALGALAALPYRREKLSAPPGSIPLLIFTLWTILSALASGSPAAALWESKELLLLGVPVLGFNLLDGARHTDRAGMAALAAGIGLAAWGILEFARGLLNPYERIRGPLSHHLTYAGVILLLLIAATAWSASAHAALRRLALFSIAPLGTALLLNQSRSAWLGAAAGLGLLATRRQHRLAAGLLGVALAATVAVPALRARALSIATPGADTSVVARRAMQGTAVAIISENLWLGTGPGGVPAAYARLQGPEYPLPLVQHLHSNTLQITAERGLPACAAWAAFWLALALGVGRLPARAAGAERPELAWLALACCVAFLVMGIFEYNFGDAEPSTLLLGLVTLPFARSCPAAGASAWKIPPEE